MAIVQQFVGYYEESCIQNSRCCMWFDDEEMLAVNEHCKSFWLRWVQWNLVRHMRWQYDSRVFFGKKARASEAARMASFWVFEKNDFTRSGVDIMFAPDLE
jgi:hypothetical protein